MKSVLISIRPRWCELIASGKKTVEVRKTRPKLETPFKVYIYCTLARQPIREDGQILMYEDDLALTNRWGQGKRVANPCGSMMDGELFLNGKVIGEFVCDEIYPIKVHPNGAIQNWNWYELSKSCLSLDDVAHYVGINKTGYGWHISDLVIYDKPKELSEFFAYCGDNPKCDGCEAHYYSNTECGKEDYCCSVIDGCKPIKRPPQSWCYVEEVKDNG